MKKYFFSIMGSVIVILGSSVCLCMGINYTRADSTPITLKYNSITVDEQVNCPECKKIPLSLNPYTKPQPLSLGQSATLPADSASSLSFTWETDICNKNGKPPCPLFGVTLPERWCSTSSYELNLIINCTSGCSFNLKCAPPTEAEVKKELSEKRP